MADSHPQGAILHRALLLINGKSTKLATILRTNYTPETCRARVTEQVDIDRRAIFSLSGYRGKNPVLARFTGFEFRLHKRRYWRNDFAPVLYGRLVAESRGTRVETYWGIQRWARIFMRIWLSFAALTGVPIFFASLSQLVAGRQSVQGDLYVGLLVPPGMLLFGMLLPKIGSALGLREKRFLVEFLERVLIAGEIADEKPTKTWDHRWSSYRRT
jgi:hypothetical protein